MRNGRLFDISDDATPGGGDHHGLYEFGPVVIE
jgi:predicted heme/steroid binding protein